MYPSNATDERKSEPQTQTSESAKGKPGSSMRGFMKRSRISLPYALPASYSSCRSGGRRSSGGGLSSGGVQRIGCATRLITRGGPKDATLSATQSGSPQSTAE